MQTVRKPCLSFLFRLRPADSSEGPLTFTNAIVGQVALSVVANLALWAWVVWATPRVVVVRWLHLGGLALALPGFVVVRAGYASEPVLRHELTHIAQMRRYSPIGASLLLGWHYGFGFLRHRAVSREVFWQLWRENPLEREAMEAMYVTTPMPKLIGWPLV